MPGPALLTPGTDPADVPTPPAGSVYWFLNSATSLPSYKDSTGTVHSFVGALGATGVKGDIGPPGVDGEDGEPGPPGIAGATGATGATGAPSTTPGPIGPPGMEGETGSDGDPGPPGPAGPPGNPGATGATGPAGPPGIGMDGEDGEDGMRGPPGPGGAVELLQEVVVGAGGVASVNFAAIPASYRDLRLIVRGRGDKAALTATVRIQFNGDTGANYDTQRIGAQNTTVTGANGLASTDLSVGFLTGATATAGIGAGVEVAIYDYRGTTFQKQIQSASGVKSSNAAAGVYTETRTGWWRSTAAISSLLTYPDSGNYIEGSVISLYGIK